MENVDTNLLQTPSDPPRWILRECHSSTQLRPSGGFQTPPAMPSIEPTRWRTRECPSSTQVSPSQGLQTPSEHLLGSPENPVEITEEEDKKPVTNLLSRLRPFQRHNQRQVISQNFPDESANIIHGMKKLLVSELVSANSINMDINTMIDRANGVFDALAFLRDDDMVFYGNVRSFIYWYHEWYVADGLRNGFCKEIMDHHNKLETEHKKAEEGVKNTESTLAVEKNKAALIREKIRNLEKELVQSEARVLMLTIEKEKCEEVYYAAKVELKTATAKTNQGMEMLKKIDDRRKAAINGISEMTKLLKSYSM